jgi:hypothetical protein
MSWSADTWSGRWPCCRSRSSRGAGLGYPGHGRRGPVEWTRERIRPGVALAGITLGLAWRSVPAAPAGTTKPVDWSGAVLFTVALVCLLLGVSQGQIWGPLSVATLGVMRAGSTALVAWVLWTLRARWPLVDL